MKTGALVISLDFELYWGIGDHIEYNKYQTYFDNTLKVIPEILKLFLNYEIHCTWATVGMLWNETWEEWEKNIPGTIPDYQNEVLSNYNLNKKIIQRNVNKNHFFALDIIRSINNTNGQEIGSHTYSHYYCNYIRNNDALDTDLKKAIQLASQTNNKLNSLVLPRNQFVEETLPILKDNGIKSVRTNPNVWFWNLKYQNNKSSRIARLLDSYTTIFTFKSYPWQNLQIKNDILLQPASRFLRPINKKIPLLNRQRITRIKSEMTFAAKNNQIYHLWWHPHNFAIETNLALKGLEEILQHFQILKNKYKFESYNMENVYYEYTKNA